MTDPIEKLLRDAGFVVVEGKDAVLVMIQDKADSTRTPLLCSGYRVFPSGRKCKGCSDCRKDSFHD